MSVGFRSLRTALIVTAIGTFACGPPTLLDTGLRPVTEPAFVTPVPHGWLAVDTAGTPRAIVESRIRSSDPRPIAPWPALQLECSAKHLHRPDRFRIEDPSCLPDLSAADCREGPACGFALRQSDRCTHVLRVEFWLHDLPILGDTLVFVAGGRRVSRVVASR